MLNTLLIAWRRARYAAGDVKETERKKKRVKSDQNKPGRLMATGMA
jgi:hypothetical protein